MILSRTPEPEVMDSVVEAADYDAMDHSEVNRRFVEDFLVFSRPRRPSEQSDTEWRIIDLGTGTAQIPILLSQCLDVSHTIVAADLSWEMLCVARRNIAVAGCSGTVLPVYCNARRLPMADQSCDLLISNSIIHHIPDPSHVFAEMHRIASPGATIFFRDLLRPSTERELEGLVARWAGEANSHQQQMFRESLHAAFTIAEIRELLDATGLDPEWVQQTTDRHWTVAGRVRGEADERRHVRSYG